MQLASKISELALGGSLTHTLQKYCFFNNNKMSILFCPGSVFLGCLKCLHCLLTQTAICDVQIHYCTDSGSQSLLSIIIRSLQFVLETSITSMTNDTKIYSHSTANKSHSFFALALYFLRCFNFSLLSCLLDLFCDVLIHSGCETFLEMLSV